MTQALAAAPGLVGSRDMREILACFTCHRSGFVCFGAKCTVTVYVPFLLKPISVDSHYSKTRRPRRTAIFSRKVLRLPSRLVENAKCWLLLSQLRKGYTLESPFVPHWVI